MSIQYRRAQAADIPAVAALLAALFAIEQDFSADPARQIAALTRMLERDDILLQIAENEGEVVGFCSVQSLISTAEGGGVGLIEDVVVAPVWRGRGIGRGLLEAAEAWSKHRGYTRLQLLADEDNAPALEFYRRQGWQRTNMHNWRKLLAA